MVLSPLSFCLIGMTQQDAATEKKVLVVLHQFEKTGEAREEKNPHFLLINRLVVKLLALYVPGNGKRERQNESENLLLNFLTKP
jgi:hypothetical protein